MKPFLSNTAGVSFLFGYSYTVCYHSDSIEYINKLSGNGKKTIYAHAYVAYSDRNSLMVFCNWESYFQHLENIKDMGHFLAMLKKPCPLFVSILTGKEPHRVTQVRMDGVSGLGIELGRLDMKGRSPYEIVFLPEVLNACDTILDVALALYNEMQNCPLAAWKERLKEVWK